jgi:hypothetical protein
VVNAKERARADVGNNFIDENFLVFTQEDELERLRTGDVAAYAALD